MLRQILLLAVTGTLCLALPTPQQPSDADMRETFQSVLALLDSDGDGKLSLEEFVWIWRLAQPTFGDAEFQQEFAAMDADGDGLIDLADFVHAARSPALAEIVSFRTVDAYHDGLIPVSTALQVAGSLHLTNDPNEVMYALIYADYNGDGNLDLDEFDAAVAALRYGST